MLILAWLNEIDGTAALGWLFFVLLGVVCWFLVEMWEISYIRKQTVLDRSTDRWLQKVMDTPNESVQLLRWQLFKNTTELEHRAWYVFRLENGSYIVEQYDQELNWRFYVPHTDYVTHFAQLEHGQI
jgi:hypothetical protein